MGTARRMTDDLQRIVKSVRSQVPDAQWEQLEVTFPADDDGLWFFCRPGGTYNDVEIESSSGGCPFLIETRFDDERRVGRTPDEVVRHIVDLLSG